MSQNIIPFQFDTHSIRVVMDDAGEPWFVAADVCAVLEIGNSRQALSRLDEDEKGVISNDTPGGRQEMSTVSEPGLYSLVLGSRKPEARAFKRWVTHEVIPQIRKTGKYEIAPTYNIPKTYAQALRLAAEQQELIEEQQRQLEAAQPAVQFHDEVAYRPDAEFLIRVAAKTLLGGERGAERKLVEWLLRQGWITKTGGAREASAQSVRSGLMRQRIEVVNGYPYQVAVITGKGMCALRLAIRAGQLFTATIPPDRLLPLAET